MTAAVAVRERPILMSGPMVRAVLEGRKTQTRRVLRNQSRTMDICMDVPECRASLIERCSYGQRGGRLWVRETWCYDGKDGALYRADYEEQPDWKWVRGWRPSIHMPREHSRLTLEITGVRVERVQDITDDDAWDEGCEGWTGEPIDTGERWVLPRVNPREQYRALWDSLNAKRGYPWDSNPWVWVLEFRRVDA